MESVKLLTKIISARYRQTLKQTKDTGRLIRLDAGKVEGFYRSIYRFTDENGEDINLMAFRDCESKLITIFCLELEQSDETQAEWDKEMEALLRLVSEDTPGRHRRIQMLEGFDAILCSLSEDKH